MRPGAWVAELTGMLDLPAWLKGMRVIVARSAPTPGLSCGSSISAATASPVSPPMPRPDSSPRWSCGTATGPGARTRIQVLAPGKQLEPDPATRKEPKGKWNPVHRRDSRAARLTTGRKPAANGSHSPLNQDHERSRPMLLLVRSPGMGPRTP
jgi:hypothetical protein